MTNSLSATGEDAKDEDGEGESTAAEPTAIESIQQKKSNDELNVLIRMAIDFCVSIQDEVFLFYDLVNLIKQHKVQDKFLDQLKPFMMAGRFSNWELPKEILEDHVIKYFQDPAKPEILEKIIVNLSLRNCSKAAILDLTTFAEENFLSTLILYLNTSVYDGSGEDDISCFYVFFNLFKLYRKA